MKLIKIASQQTYVTPESITAEIAKMNSQEQAEFFELIFESLKTACGDQYNYEVQLSYIQESMKHNTKAALEFWAAEVEA